eukprot:6213379-Pleurochrysis_carterae.AAC.4
MSRARPSRRCNQLENLGGLPLVYHWGEPGTQHSVVDVKENKQLVERFGLRRHARSLFLPSLI